MSNVFYNVVQQIDQIHSKIIATALESKKKPKSKSATPGPQTVALLEGWNGSVRKSQPCLAHELIGKQCHAQPYAPSVYSWDGELTYNQLDRLSSRLAARLIHHGVRPDSFVLVMQEKSRWTAVTLLAVMRAGGAFVMTDCSYPLQRIQQICDQTKPWVVVSSKNTKDMAQKVGAQLVITVGDEDLSESDMGKTDTQEPTLVGTRNALYAVCTSGSTGKPKTVVVEHAPFCSMALATGPKYGPTSQTRTFQYVSHAFDVCILDYLATWIWGGCVCIASEADREDLAQGIIATQANHIHLTPSVARLLNSSDVPCVKSIVLGGEPCTQRDFDQWQGKATLAIGYGPAECAINSCLRNISEREGGPSLHPTNIGPAVGCIGWVVDETDPNQLVDVGCIGELLIEGPNLALGYLNDPEKTHAAFIEDPSWLKHFRSCDKGPHRLYKTGDLVTKQQLDGSFQFVGRKDSQVKLNGQRIELTEVEYHVQRCLPVAIEVVVDMVTVVGEKHSRSALLAFVKPHDHPVISDNNENNDDSLFISTHPTLRVDIDAATARLRNEIPNYLIPTAFLILRHVPLSSSGKTDRRRLRQAASALSWRELQGSQAMANTSHQPSTEVETTLQQYCASVLNEGRPENIGLDDNLSHLGMDSLTAIQLIIKCRQDDLAISVRDILTHQTIARLAPHVKRIRVLETTAQKTAWQPFDLSLYQDSFQRRVMGNIAIDGLEMTAAYPCSPMQRGILLSQARNPHLYENLVVWEIKSRDSSKLVDINRLQHSWRSIVQRHQILRTIFVEPVAQDTIPNSVPPLS